MKKRGKLGKINIADDNKAKAAHNNQQGHRDTDQRIVGIPDDAVFRFFKSKDLESGVAVGRNSGEDGDPNSMKPKLRDKTKGKNSRSDQFAAEGVLRR